MALLKFRGMLVVGEVRLSDSGACPDCRAPWQPVPWHGWLECGQCGFGILKSDLDRMVHAREEASDAERK